MRYILFISLLFLLCCTKSRQTPALIYKVKIDPPKVIEHIVVDGENSFAIAWSNGMTLEKFLDLNNFDKEHKVKAGDRVKVSSMFANYSVSPPNIVKTKTQPKVKAKKQEVAKVTPVNKKTVRKSIFIWPVTGKVIASFSSSNKGIDIKQDLGRRVVAAKEGLVVYSGNGIKEYGNLVIIKHDHEYITAYAHNKRILVKEGDSVRAGQVISEVGSTGTSTSKLHFEVRKNGEPLDPIHYLPKL